MRNHQMFLSRQPLCKGLSLIELMVVVAILGILLSVAIPSLADLMERRRVAAVALEVSSVLNNAKSEANLSYDQITVHIEKDPSNTLSCIAFNAQHGSDYACNCYNPAENMCGGNNIPILRLFQIKNIDGVSFEASADHWGVRGPGRLGFARNKYFTNTSNVYGVKVLVTGRRTGAQLRVELNEANRIRICSPNSSIGGFPSC